MSTMWFMLGLIAGVMSGIAHWITVKNWWSGKSTAVRDARPVNVVEGVQYPDPEDPRWCRSSRAPWSGVNFRLGSVTVTCRTSLSCDTGVRVYMPDGSDRWFAGVEAQAYAETVYVHAVRRDAEAIQSQVDKIARCC